MSNSVRAKERRQKRSSLSKCQRTRLANQHFGDEHVYQGRRLERGQSKKELMEQSSK